MPTDLGEVRTELRRPREWSLLFRGFQLARDPYKIIIAIGAVVALALGWWLLGLIFLNDTSAQDQRRAALYGRWPADVDRGPNPFIVTLSPEGRTRLYTTEYWFGSTNEGPPLQVEPFRQFYQPVLNMFLTSGKVWWYSFFGIFWSLAVWALAGGAITRIAAVQIARNEQVGLGEAIGYARRKFFDFFIGPAIPLIILFFLALLTALGTELTQIPYLGGIIVALLMFLVFLAGLVMVAMVIALIGWPLFYATIAAEGSDSFDALSRTLAYVTSRAWSFIKYVVVALLYSIVVIFIVVFLVSATVYLARWSMGLAPGLGWQDTADPVGSMHVLAPRWYQWRDLLVNGLNEPHPYVKIHDRLNQHLLVGNNLQEFKAGLNAGRDVKDLMPDDVKRDLGLSKDQPPPNLNNTFKDFYQNKTAEDLVLPQSKYDFVWAFMNWGQRTAAGITAFWLHLIFLGLVGFAYSLFWSLGTIIYFLLRREVDETEFEEVYIEDEDELVPPPITSAAAAPTPPPPLAGSGVPAPEQRPAMAPVLPPPMSPAAPPEPTTPPDRPPGFSSNEPGTT